VGISYNGTDVNDVVRASSDFTLNFQTNSQPSNFVALMKKGTVIYVKGAAAGVGLIYMTAYYQQNA
jgi:hypothetical protein